MRKGKLKRSDDYGTFVEGRDKWYFVKTQGILGARPSFSEQPRTTYVFEVDIAQDGRKIINLAKSVEFVENVVGLPQAMETHARMCQKYDIYGRKHEFNPVTRNYHAVGSDELDRLERIQRETLKASRGD